MRPVLSYSSYRPASWPSKGPRKALHIFFRKEHNSEKPPVGEFSFQSDLDRPVHPPRGHGHREPARLLGQEKREVNFRSQKKVGSSFQMAGM